MAFHLETRRLVLVEMREADTDALAEVLGDAESMRYYPAPFNRDEVIAWIDTQVGGYAKRGHGLWGVVLKDGGRFIGDCGLVVQQPFGDEEIEVGWHLHPDHQRRGYATEAATACVQWAFANLDVPRLISMIRPENTPSQGVARNVGMTPTRSFDYKGLLHNLWVIERESA